jgi:hypothetical protein
MTDEYEGISASFAAACRKADEAYRRANRKEIPQQHQQPCHPDKCDVFRCRHD